MSKAGQRRLRKKAQALRELASKDTEGFRRVWGYHVECWAEEARQRGQVRGYRNRKPLPEDIYMAHDTQYRYRATWGKLAEKQCPDMA